MKIFVLKIQPFTALAQVLISMKNSAKIANLFLLREHFVFHIKRVEKCVNTRKMCKHF